MALDFPATPTLNQQFSSGTSTWQWDGTAWNVVPQMTPAVASDTPPANPAIGQFWWRASNGVLYVYVDDGNSKQWVQASPGNSLSSATALRNNHVINGSMAVSQENGDTISATSSAVTYYSADQWISSFFLAGTAYSGAGATDTGNRSIACAIATATPSLAAGNAAHFYQTIEGLNVKDLRWGTAKAKQVVLTFRLYAPVAGTYSAYIRNGATNRSYVVNFTAAVGWGGYTLTIPGDTTGTWATDNTVAMYVGVALAVGTTLVAPAAGWNAGNYLAAPGVSNGAAAVGTFYLGDVGLYADPNNTGVAPAYEVEDYATTVLKCQRYWYAQSIYATQYMNSATNISVTTPHKVTMRSTPTVTFPIVNYSNAAGISATSAQADGLIWTYTASAAGVATFNGRYAANARM